MAQTITRSGTRSGARSGTDRPGAVRRQSRSRGSSRARGASGSLFDPLLRAIPLDEGQWRALFTALILGGTLALALVVAIAAGVPELVRLRLAETAASAGYEVRRVEVRGVERMNELEVYERALATRNRAMTELDLAALRRSLLSLPYVADARIVRQLPDGLVVDIVEREPHAVLREGNSLLFLIDIEGHKLERLAPSEVDGRVLVAGAGVRRQVQGLDRLLDTAPQLRERIVAAQWIGERRWTLTFATGQELALPQGEAKAAAALASFARLDDTNGLVGGEVALFDMRSPERMYLRVPGRAAAAAAKAQGS